MKNKLKFKILKKIWNARVWQITLNWIKLTTPVFMPVWTKATIKGLVLDMLKDPKYTGSKIPINLILANTFHLYLRPGDKLVKKTWWLHKFENRPSLILTDSGWFQVFSLWLGKKENNDTDNRPESKHNVWMKLSEHWVKFNSPFDWSKHEFTPENVVDIQCNLWSDIMMVLDVCSPSDANKKTINEHMQMTHRRAKRAFDHFKKKYDKSRWVLFPIVQWWTFKDLRAESIEFLSNYARDWIAVGWVSVWEKKSLIQDIVKFCWDKLPEDKPRYLMWVGTPEDILHAVKNWFDMFDCVLPTRLGRHWVWFSDKWNIKISNAQYRNDFKPLTKSCKCYTCTNFTKAYIHHLVREKEMLWGILLSLHNIAYLHNMLEEWKNKILKK